ncbi:SDR family oxidoreductase [Simiduia curdlanivorans]|uniref:SDR family oxidoreductase n=1 Tax=Simiduia curdlanivorans TaxID=1492769 RepID=A0ABV8V8B5_9GAMM|nr:SDR family oxidoreductase [Simiduia curdlanivorans]MDN3639100.1 SDR family oxidoreductase [Simiduia curdlanivorans]
MPTKRILITGAAGYIGFQLGERLCRDFSVIGVDIRPRNDAHFPIHVIDIRSPQLSQLMAVEGITHVIHLACVVEPSKNVQRDYDIDVNGTRNLLDACVTNHIKHLTVTSSGAAYGYHADNPDWIVETDPLRGNDEFSYAAHKRLVEEILAGYRKTHPSLNQLIFRPGTVLGSDTNNLITQLFTGKRLLAISGSPSPFVFIWDQDVIALIEQGLREEKVGQYNMAGDGAMTIQDIATALNKPVLNLPAGLVKFLLRVGSALGLTRYGPEQINFLRYRPVLLNEALKAQFGGNLQKTSRETFLYFAEHALKLAPKKG